MFWRRKDVKLAGMLAYRKNALRAILVSLVTMIFTGVISFNMVFERVTTGTNTTDATSSMVAGPIEAASCLYTPTKQLPWQNCISFCGMNI